MAEWKELGNKAKNLTLAGLGKARDLGQSAKLNLDNVSEEENRKRIYVEIGKRFVSEHATAPEGGGRAQTKPGALKVHRVFNRESLLCRRAQRIRRAAK